MNADREGKVKKYAKIASEVFLFSLVCLSLLFSTPLLSEEVKVYSTTELTSTCVGCHTGIDSILASTPHRIIFTPEGKRIKNSPISCADCHPNWEKHLEEPGVGNIIHPAKITFLENHKICTQCHSNPHAQEEPEFDIHFKNKVTCSSCHSVLQPKEKHLLVLSPNDLCLSCHPEIVGKLSLVSRHPVSQKTILCIDCHIFLDPLDKPLSFASVNFRCFSCHAEFQGPFPYEHGATKDYTIEKEGCIYCHDPHGSPNPRLLKQPVRPLCLNCHLLPKHQTAHGGIWGNTNCLECHVDIHGSYASEDLFTEDLFGGTCLGYGCHAP